MQSENQKWNILKARILDRIKKTRKQHEDITGEFNTQSDIWKKIHLLIKADKIDSESEAYQRTLRTMDTLEREEIDR